MRGEVRECVRSGFTSWWGLLAIGADIHLRVSRLASSEGPNWPDLGMQLRGAFVRGWYGKACGGVCVTAREEGMVGREVL